MVTTGLQAVAQCQKNCLPQFADINHFWDNARNLVVAKILPGEFYVSKQHLAVATTLGSCVAACIWDIEKKIGGMNHFMLPLSLKAEQEVSWGQRGLISDATRYGNFAMEHLINTILKCGGNRENLRAKVFGGSKVLTNMSDVGKRNSEFVLEYLAAENIQIVSADLGTIFPRKVLFEPQSGRAFVKKLSSFHNNTILQRENEYSLQIIHRPVEGDVELF